ncbi:MAG: GGDEF domain-containing protein, partial [Methylococcales bacterium]
NVLWLEAQEGLDQHTAILDPLTKLPTRVEFLNALEEKIEHYKIDPSPFSLILVSLNAFQKLSQHGDNREVDQMVLQVAEVIKQETRLPLDTVTRYDAATFAIILPGAETSTAEVIAQRICKNSVTQTQLQSTDSIVSIGVAEYPAHLTCGTDESIQNQISSILQTTDKALKTAQQQGNNRICCAAKIT